nr:PREDICTED: uncharacterized protein CG3556 isoform X2 [Bemisia tabaci]
MISEEKIALNWLLNQRLKDYSWGNGEDTALTLLTLELTRTGDPAQRQLTAKQLEIDLILHLWRHHDVTATHLAKERTLTPGKIALYSLALSATCNDPRQFHGHDLIGSLLHHEAESDVDFSLSVLAICNAGAHIRKRNLRRLLNIANSKHTVETLSSVVMALQCIVEDHRNRNLEHYTNKPLLTLARLQQADGSFGSLHGTALAAQALQDENELWNRSSAISWLVNHQNPDGGFFDVPTTAEVILALADKGLGSVREIECDSTIRGYESDSSLNIPNLSVTTEETIHAVTENESKNKTDTSRKSKDISTKKEKPDKARNSKNSGSKEKEALKTKSMKESASLSSKETVKDVLLEYATQAPAVDVTVTYTLWIGSNITDNQSISITTQHNSTFYNVMQLAAEKDSQHYSFSATEWPNGHYVHTLAGWKEEPMSYHYWLLYQLTSLPDPNNPPGNQLVAPTGVDDLIVQDGQHYLFWYKKL